MKIILADCDAQDFAKDLIWLGISFTVSYTNCSNKDTIFSSEEEEFEKLTKKYLKDAIAELNSE